MKHTVEIFTIAFTLLIASVLGGMVHQAVRPVSDVNDIHEAVLFYIEDDMIKSHTIR